MNILFVTGIFPPDHGGPATYVPAMARALQERGHGIVGVVTLSETLDHDDSRFGFPVIRIRRGLPRGWRMLRTIAMLRRLCAKADVVYINGLMIEGTIAGKVLVNKRMVMRVGGDRIWERARNQRFFYGQMEAFQRARLSLKWRMLRAIQAWYTRRADALITPSRFLAEIVQGWGVPAERVNIVYNAVAPGGAVAPRSTETVDLITVARLTVFKGVGDLIDLAARFNWSLKVVGDGPLRKELEGRATRASATVQIFFTGHVPQHQVLHEIASARIFILNSSTEGMPNTLLEAKSVGVPVVATAVGGNLEVVRDGIDGFLVPYGDLELLQARVKQLLKDKALRARMGAEGRRDMHTRFFFQDMVDRTEVILQKVAG